MLEKNIPLEGQFPKGLDAVPASFDRVVNMSGVNLPSGIAPVVEEWAIVDPIGQSIDVFRAVRDEIEHRVMRLVLGLRMQKSNSAKPRRKRI